MATVKDISNQRPGNYTNVGAGFTKGSMISPFPGHGQTPRFVMSPGLPMQAYHGGAHIDGLTGQMNNMNLQQASLSTAKAGSQYSAASSDFGSAPMASSGTIYPGYQNMPMMNQNHGVASLHQAHPAIQHSPGIYGQVTSYLPHTNYGTYNAHLDSPVGTWGSRVSSSEIPSLMTPRRDSTSSNENDLPGTPYTGYNTYSHNAVAVMDRTPSTVFTHSATPSPSQLGPLYHVPHVQKAAPPSQISPELLVLLQKEPAIPPAIPAPNSPAKPLDRALENKNGETNVYIRGLQPETTDEQLHAWGIRFGDIQSSKSIIDQKTGLCKGFGFIKYHNFEDAESCIRGFHHLGYEVSFARESFYAKLKKFADESNTNLYVSNIPKNFNEHELATIFSPHKVCSSRVLRDQNGNGRGVGFARFETREICEEIIKNFNNTVVNKPGGEDHVIQIRYADTQEQKLLKQQTAAARQFRAAEFDLGVQQARLGNIMGSPSPARLPGITSSEHDPASDFEKFMIGTTSYYPQPYAHPGANRLGFRNPNPTPRFVPRFPKPIPQVNLPASIKIDSDLTTSASEDDAIKNRPSTPITPATPNDDDSSVNSNVSDGQHE